MPNETCSFNIVSNLHRNPFCALCRGTKSYNGEWERARWREGAAIGVEFILFTFSRNPVMIASYKIDEICHKNEDVCFYVYRAVGVYKSRFSVSIFLLCCALLLALFLSFGRRFGRWYRLGTALFIMDLGVKAISERHSAIINGYDEKYFYINSVNRGRGGAAS